MKTCSSCSEPTLPFIFYFPLSCAGSSGWSHSQHALAKRQGTSQNVLYTFTGRICIYIYKQTHNAFSFESPVCRVHGLWRQTGAPWGNHTDTGRTHRFDKLIDSHGVRRQCESVSHCINTFRSNVEWKQLGGGSRESYKLRLMVD